jgi:hypothetical protein
MIVGATCCRPPVIKLEHGQYQLHDDAFAEWREIHSVCTLTHPRLAHGARCAISGVGSVRAVRIIACIEEAAVIESIDPCA